MAGAIGGLGASSRVWCDLRGTVTPSFNEPNVCWNGRVGSANERGPVLFSGERVCFKVGDDFTDDCHTWLLTNRNESIQHKSIQDYVNDCGNITAIPGKLKDEWDKQCELIPSDDKGDIFACKNYPTISCTTTQTSKSHQTAFSLKTMIITAVAATTSSFLFFK